MNGKNIEGMRRSYASKYPSHEDLTLSILAGASSNLKSGVQSSPHSLLCFLTVLTPPCPSPVLCPSLSASNLTLYHEVSPAPGPLHIFPSSPTWHIVVAPPQIFIDVLTFRQQRKT